MTARSSIQMVSSHVAVIRDKRAVVEFTARTNSDTTPHSTPVKIQTGKLQGSEEKQVIKWGKNNDRPQLILKELDKWAILKAGLRARQHAHYGAGYQYYTEKFEGGKRILEPTDLTAYPAMAALEEGNRIPKILREGIMNFEHWGFVCTEMITSPNRQAILSMRPLKSAWVRFAPQNESGQLHRLTYTPNWPKDTHGVPINMVDPYMTPAEARQCAIDNNWERFAYCSFIPDPDRIDYPELDWQALYDNGTMVNANSIPALKKQMFQNQIMSSYHIQIPENYLANKYHQSWEAWNEEERQTKRNEVFTQLNTAMAGEEGFMKALITFFEIDPESQKEVGFKIDVIDNKLKDGAYLPESAANNSEGLASLMVDPTILGQGVPGGKLGAGSGSDKREAFLLLNAMLKGPREHTVEALEFAHQYNGGPKALKVGYVNYNLATLDVNPTGGQNSLM